MADMVQVSITDGATTIHLTAGDDDREPSEVLYDILKRSLKETYDFEPHEQEFAKSLCDKMDAAIFTYAKTN